MGNSGAIWVVKTPTQKFILRNTGNQINYLKFQIKVIEEIRKTAFPYYLPEFKKTKNGNSYVDNQDNYWILYDFIEGRPITRFSQSKAQEMGALAANFHKFSQEASHSLTQEYPMNYSSPNLETEWGNSSIASVEKIYLSNSFIFFPRKYYHRSIQNLLDEYKKITQIQRQIAEKIPIIPAYIDWHGNNIIQNHGKIVGIIDFDSLTIAPRILDLQNALFQFFDPLRGILNSKGNAFLKGYNSMLKLSSNEIEVAYFLLIERLIWWIKYLLEDSPKNRNIAPLLLRSLQISNWLIKNRFRFQSFLCSGL